MAGCKKTSVYTSLYRNPLIEQQNSSEGGGNGVSLGLHIRRNLAAVSDDKENSSPNVKSAKIDYGGKENAAAADDYENTPILKKNPSGKSQMRENLLKPSSLQLCIKKHEPHSNVGLKVWDSADSQRFNSVDVWDYSDSEAAPASSWSTLPNR